jgi:signal transduction histidine kinase
MDSNGSDRLLARQVDTLTLIACEMHDGIGQYLTAGIGYMEMFRELRTRCPREAEASLQQALTAFTDGLAEVRRLIANLGRPLLDSGGLVNAIERLIGEDDRLRGITVDLDHAFPPGLLSPCEQSIIYRIVQEALINVARHSRTTRARVEVFLVGEFLEIVVQDWGIGFDPDCVVRGHFGLEGMRARAAILGGEFSIETARCRGARITVKLPVSTTPSQQASDKSAEALPRRG